MTMWHTVLQDASYKGIRFDVVNIEESDGKALVEHARPFANGTTLEDMGTTGRQVQIAAVFWGKGYQSRLNKLVETLMQSGAGVLVHPVWGRMPNMIAASWHFRHEADYVDYATLDITFRESGELQKIFVFENQFLMELERLIAQIDTYRAALEGFIDSMAMVKRDTSALFGSALGLWSAARGVFGAVRSVLDLDVLHWGDKSAYSSANFGCDMSSLHRDLGDMLHTGLLQKAQIDANRERDNTHNSETAKTRMDTLLRENQTLHSLPRQVQAGLRAGGGHLAQAVHFDLLRDMLRWQGLRVQMQAALWLIEAHGSSMTAPELMHINRRLRQNLHDEIARLRSWLQTMQALHNAPYLATYQRCEALIEQMRQCAGCLNRLMIAAINQKPPLVVRPAPLSGTVQQIAFAFYGDFNRSDELTRLNPQITHPNFIVKGQLMNGYST